MKDFEPTRTAVDSRAAGHPLHSTALVRPVAPGGGVAHPALVVGTGPLTTRIPPGTPPDALEILQALRRRWKLALGAGLILAGIASVAAWMLIPPSKYTATALLQVAATQPKVIFKTEETRADFVTYQTTQRTMIKSRNVLTRALNDPAVSGLAVVRAQVNPVLWLEKKIDADYLGEVFRISMSGDKPDDLAVLVNAVTNAYIKEIVEGESKERWARHDELKKIYDEYQRRLEQRRGDLKKLAQRVGSKDKETVRLTQELSMERLASTRRELIQVQGDLRRAKAELEIREAQQRDEPAAAAVGPSEAAIRQLVEEDEEVKQIRADIASLEASAAKVAGVARDRSDPSRLAKQQQILAARKALEARYAAVWPRAVEQLSRVEAEGEVSSSLRGLRHRVEVLGELGRVTQAIVDAQAAETKEIGQDSLYIDAIQDEIGHADNAAKRIGEELVSLSVELRAPSRVRQFESADAPRREDDKRVFKAGAAGLGTFGLFAFVVAFAEFRTRRISSVDEVIQKLGLRVVGSLPIVRRPGRDGRPAPRKSGPYGDNLLVESIDSIRTLLLHSTGDRSLRSIMVTSATSGEGKTSLACHLATSLARSGLRTLLIDCDLRKPTVHRLYNLGAGPGISEYLRGEVTADAVVRATTVDGPNVITAGSCDARALSALALANSGEIFEAFQGSHDIIVVDTSPVLPVTDALLVGRHVDAAVCSIRRDVSRLPWALAAVERLRSLNIRIVGAVVTGIQAHPYGTYYGGGRTDEQAVDARR